MSQANRRANTERRKICQPFHIRSITGRRREVRRSDCAKTASLNIDTYPPVYLAITLGILSLCFADAFNTLQLIKNGAKELNPFMDALIRNDVQLFVMTKFALTSLGLLVLLGYRHARILNRLKAKHLMLAVFAMYIALICYQSFLMPKHTLAFVFWI